MVELLQMEIKIGSGDSDKVKMGPGMREKEVKEVMVRVDMILKANSCKMKRMIEIYRYT